MNESLTFVYSQIMHDKPYSLKQNYAIHSVTYVTFCITTLFLGNYYACRFISFDVFITDYLGLVIYVATNLF